MKPVRPPRIYNYISQDDFEKIKNGLLWQGSRPVIPFAIIDPRLMDLAISFWKSPDANLMDGYRKFEDIVRKRTGINETGASLFTQAFLQESSILSWKGIGNGEKDCKSQPYYQCLFSVSKSSNA